MGNYNASEIDIKVSSVTLYFAFSIRWMVILETAAMSASCCWDIPAFSLSTLRWTAKALMEAGFFITPRR